METLADSLVDANNPLNKLFIGFFVPSSSAESPEGLSQLKPHLEKLIVKLFLKKKKAAFYFVDAVH